MVPAIVIPIIVGGLIGLGAEGCNQIMEGDFDAERLVNAGIGGAIGGAVVAAGAPVSVGTGTLAVAGGFGGMIGGQTTRMLNGDPTSPEDVAVDFVGGYLAAGAASLLPDMAEAGKAAIKQAFGKSAPAKGMANPKVRAAVERGQREHAKRDYGEGYVKEVALPSGKKMDAYNKDTKHIKELKPNNPKAIKKGEKQLEGYIKECDQAYGCGHTGEVVTYDAD
jgi:hypothetical protein